jgi:serine/threonine protein kinase
MDDLQGRTIGQYQILKEIGRGGMAIVYRAFQPSLNRYVAIKVLPPQLSFDREFVERFHREAQAAARLRHPNIVVIYDVGQQDDVHYIAMELLEGHTLKDLIQQEGSLPSERVIHIVRQAASALDYAHRQGFVHRDVKPANIFVGPDDHTTLADFGIAKAASGTQLTRSGALMGTPEYMSPEQAQGLDIDHRTDVYALAIAAYQMLSGRVPFGGTTPHAVLYQQIHEPPPPIRTLRPDLSPALEGVLDKSLAKDPRARHGSAGAFAQALAGAVAHAVEDRSAVTAPEAQLKVVAPPPRSPAAQSVPGTRERTPFPAWLWGLAGLAVVVLVVAVILLALGGGGDGTSLPPTTPDAAEATRTVTASQTDTPVLLTSTLVPSPTPILPTETPLPTDTPVPTGAPTATATPDRSQLEGALLGRVQWRAGTGTPIFAYRVDQPPLVDGNLDTADEWTGAQYSISHVTFKPENWFGPDDLSGRFYSAWDENFLYLGLDIRDDRHVQVSSGEALYQGDDVEIQIDVDLLGDWGDTELSDDDGQLGLAVRDLLSGQYEAFLWRPPARKGSLSVKLAARQTAGGYVLEAALPWWALNLSPRVETPYGFCLSLADTDTPGLQDQESMASTCPGRMWGDPTTWGTLILVDW